MSGTEALVFVSIVLVDFVIVPAAIYFGVRL